MESDLKGIPASLDPGQLDQMSQLANYQVSRLKAEMWSIKDCKFLVFDDMDENGQPSGTYLDPNEPSKNGFVCRICTSCPEFPHDRKPRNFRLFRPRDVFLELGSLDSTASMDICSHYVAVSYCWPEPLKDSNGNTLSPTGSYRVRDLNGIIRANRAPDDVINRAVDAANSLGLRMIWIDQECLPQPNDKSPQEVKDEQELGLQAMDIIYNRAIMTAGLHDTELTSQLQVDILKALGTSKNTSPNIRRDYFSLAIDFFKQVRRDRWYTRAWVIQEAVSAGRNLMLIFRRGAGITFSSTFRFTTELTPPKHSLDLIPRDLPSDVVCITVDQFQQMVRRMKNFLQNQLIKPPLEKAQLDNATKVIAEAEALHPALMATKSGIFTVNIYCLNNYGARHSVNGAGALTLLKSRACRDEQDLIAIVANLCHYEIRLNTRLVAKHCTSLRLAILALALLNGDFSLLVPELYSFPGTLNGPLKLGTSSWLDPFDVGVAWIDHSSIHPFVGHRAVQQHVAANKLGFVAYLWDIEDEFDFTPIRDQWAHVWRDLKRLKVVVDNPKKEGDCGRAFRERLMRICQHFASKGITRKAKDELLRTRAIAPDSPVWNGIGDQGIHVTSYLNADQIESTPVIQKLIAQIFFDILKFLFSMTDKDARAIGIANSIWQSMRVDSLHTNGNDYDSKDLETLPDEVSEVLFNHPDVVNSPFKTLRFDRTRGEEYHQVWLFDRIMTHGSLWVGRYRRGYEMDSLIKFIEQGKEHFASKGTGVSQLTGPGTTPQQTMRPSILHRQLGRQLDGRLNRDTLLRQLEKSGEETDPCITSGVGASVGEIFRHGIWTPEAEDGRAQNLVSVFDIDGPCLISIPYDSDWEMLPHPDLRSMSVCWLIEPKQRRDHHVMLGNFNGLDGGTTSKHDLKKDSWLGKRQDSMCQQLSIDTGIPLDRKSLLELEKMEIASRSFQVVGKVKGMWAIMDPPYQVYYFY
ncbi:hypothetical protein EDB81DRAFT_778078 [Dactylonectria macrodidyma]|uniref:Heterokaryon incompatibility domain-containing protein n=1 Tax=Dactylonectria macrodidyma TaxID=307937 RepID=A0A9P9FPN9_9HYPO|nr:hypothetical protein EDB81DRAFT_778078 [Dactylonectria macrodidyma]